MRESDGLIAEESFQLRFKSGEIAELAAMLQSEGERRGGAIEAHNAQAAWRTSQGAEERQDIGRRAEANVPDDKGRDGARNTFRQSKSG